MKNEKKVNTKRDDTSISLAPLDFEEVLKGMMKVKPKTNEEVKPKKRRKVSTRKRN